MLQAIQLAKSYRRERVLDSVDFALEPGRCLGVAGHNGSGKSTLLAVVAQVFPPDEGDLRWNGRSILGDMAFLRGRVGYVPQQGGLPEDLTVRETLRFWCKTHGLDPNGLFSPSAPAGMLGLEEIAKKRVARLSGGMQKRLSVALALLHSPVLLILDESLSALDQEYARRMEAYLQNHLRQGGLILYCSHHVGELSALCDTVMVLRNGRRVFYDAMGAFPADDPAALKVLLNP